MIKNEMLGRVGHMLVATLLLCGGLASQVFADNAPAASATQTESALFRAVMGVMLKASSNYWQMG